MGQITGKKWGFQKAEPHLFFIMKDSGPSQAEEHYPQGVDSYPSAREGRQGNPGKEGEAQWPISHGPVQNRNAGLRVEELWILRQQ